MVAAAAVWIGGTEGSLALRESVWVYPLIETVHVLAICLFVGFTALLDLRLLGCALGRTPVSEIVARIMPWTWMGFAVMVATGVLLLYGDPVRFLSNVFFQAKLGVLALAGINAAVFHATVYRRVHQWDTSPAIPIQARIAGAVSLLAWATVVLTGRMIAYNWF